jgi:hypothetical protein
MLYKKLGMLLCAALMQASFVCAALQKISNAIIDWDGRIVEAASLKDAMTNARQKDKTAAKVTLTDYCHDTIGFHGRALRSYLTQEQKARAFDACGEVLKDKDPQAYAALSEAKSAATQSGTPQKKIGGSLTKLEKRSEQMQTEAEDFQSSAAALKAKMKAEAEKPWYKF